MPNNEKRRDFSATLTRRNKHGNPRASPIKVFGSATKHLARQLRPIVRKHSTAKSYVTHLFVPGADRISAEVQHRSSTWFLTGLARSSVKWHSCFERPFSVLPWARPHNPFWMLWRKIYCLAQITGAPLEHQDLVFGHHSDPIRTKGHRVSGHAHGQIKGLGQHHGPRCREADDKQGEDRYQSADHREGQCRDQHLQKP